MIRLMVETEIFFKDEEHLSKFIEHDANKITGFSGEIITSLDSGKQVVAETPRPEFGTITRSFVTCYKIKSE